MGCVESKERYGSKNLCFSRDTRKNICKACNSNLVLRKNILPWSLILNSWLKLSVKKKKCTFGIGWVKKKSNWCFCFQTCRSVQRRSNGPLYWVGGEAEGKIWNVEFISHKYFSIFSVISPFVIDKRTLSLALSLDLDFETTHLSTILKKQTRQTAMLTLTLFLFFCCQSIILDLYIIFQ